MIAGMRLMVVEGPDRGRELELLKPSDLLPDALGEALDGAIDTLHFQIVPTERWQAFTLEFMQDQECKGAKAIEQFLGKPSGLTCPLQPQ